MVASQRVLPYGTTLHYPGCGCPPGWQRGTRLADRVDYEVEQSYLKQKSKPTERRRRLVVAYMLPHHNVTGGMKCLVEHIRLLKERGHRTVAVHRSDNAASAMPPWTLVKADVDVVCRLNQCLADVLDIKEIDVVVVGIFHQVAELLLGISAPVLYWEQGHEWIFGDPIRFEVQHSYLKQDQLFHMVLQLPVALAAVSDAVRNILDQEFGRKALLIPNGIDTDRFRPGVISENPALAGKAISKCKVLLVGNPSLSLKGFDVALRALECVNSTVPIHVTWVCQVRPTRSMLPEIAGCSLDIEYVVNPNQEGLPRLYRGQDIFLFTSRYEAWGMPVMEAMASGVAVVTTNCLGVTSFAYHGNNCLMAKADDFADCASCVLKLVTNKSLRRQLQCEARRTALMYTPEVITDTIEDVLYSLIRSSKQLLQIRRLGIYDLQAACLWASAACLPDPIRYSSNQGCSQHPEQHLAYNATYLGSQRQQLAHSAYSLSRGLTRSTSAEQVQMRSTGNSSSYLQSHATQLQHQLLLQHYQQQQREQQSSQLLLLHQQHAVGAMPHNTGDLLQQPLQQLQNGSDGVTHFRTTNTNHETAVSEELHAASNTPALWTRLAPDGTSRTLADAESWRSLIG